MDSKDLQAVKAGFKYYKEHPICLEGTTTEQDEEVEDAIFIAFIEGFQYATYDTQNTDPES